MQLLLSLVLVGAVIAVWAHVCVRLVAWQTARPQGGRPLGAELRHRLPKQRRPLLPEGHRPPPGLGPLSPSERFLTTEAARGLRELQLFLAEQRAA